MLNRGHLFRSNNFGFSLLLGRTRVFSLSILYPGSCRCASLPSFPCLTFSLVVVLLILVPLVLWDEQTRNETRRWRALLKDYVGFDCVWMPGVQVTLKA